MLRRHTVALALAVCLLPGARAGESRPPEFVVVLDPGHGGTNLGAAGVVEGVYEKRLTLALARAVAVELRLHPGFTVVLTREDDRFLTLRERARIANLAGADLFVSLHANASPTRTQRGFEMWVLSPEALEVDAPALRGDDGPPRPGTSPDVAALLDDVERGAALPVAVAFAARLDRRLAAALPTSPSRGVRQGAPDVLLGPVMPAVLLEVGFIDHPVEGADLLRHDTRAAIVDAVVAAIVEQARATALR